MHHNLTYSAPPPPPQLQPFLPHLPPAMPPPPPSRSRQFVTFSPFYQPLAHLQRESAPALREPEPSLTLSLLQPDSSVGNREQQRTEHLSFPPAFRSSSFSTCNLEQPLHDVDQSEYPMLMLRSEGGDRIAEAPSMQLLMELECPGSRPFSNDDGASPHQFDGSQLQFTPASEFPHHFQTDARLYPPPIATHDAVVQNRELFMATLGNFLEVLGTRLTAPNFFGKDMDLHAIYREVTMRGGLGQVIRNALWNELVMALNLFIPSLYASFFLRKHYTNLLYHYEQVYYFRVEGHLRSPPVPIVAPSPVVCVSEIRSPYQIQCDIGSPLKKRKRKLDPIHIFGVDPAASVGRNVTGSINGKCEEGYIVTVVVGTEKVTGVLYHAPVTNDIRQFASVPSLVGSKLDAPGLEIQLQGKNKKYPVYRKDSLYKKDPNAPRRTRTGYNIFCKEQRARLRQQYPKKDKKISRMVIDMWSRLPGDEKLFYIERGQQDRERYKRELLEYQENVGRQVGNDDAGQPLAGHDHAAYDESHDYHVSLDVEGDVMSYQGAQPRVSEMDELHPVHGYPVDKGGVGHDNRSMNCDIEQPFGMQKNLSNHPDEPLSEEGGDFEMEEELPVDKAAYPDSENCDGQEDEARYHVSNEGCDEQDDGIHTSHVGKADADKTNIHGGYAVSEQPYNLPNHVYAYPSSLHQQVLESGVMVSSVPVAFRIQDRGQGYHPHLQQSRPGPSVSSISQQQNYGCSGYFLSPFKNGPAFEAETLGIPVPSNQAGYHVQNEQVPYLSQLPLQNQAVETNVQPRPGPSEQVYQSRYPYPMHSHYSQANRQPHTYLVHFPQTHGHSTHLPETPAPQFKQAFSSLANQPQVMNSEMSGIPASSQQQYALQDEGHT